MIQVTYRKEYLKEIETLQMPLSLYPFVFPSIGTG